MPSLKYYNGSAWVSIDPEITNGSAKARLAIDRVGVGKLATYYPYLELSDSSLSNGSTKYYKDKIVMGSKTFNFPSPVANSSTLALTSDVKKVYRHSACLQLGDYGYVWVYHENTSSANLTAAQWASIIEHQILTDGYGNIFVMRYLSQSTLVYFTIFYNDGSGTYMSAVGTVSISTQSAEEV